MVVSLPSARRDMAAVEVMGRLFERARDEFPELGSRPEREQVLLAAWLVSLRSARTGAATPRMYWDGWTGSPSVSWMYWPRGECMWICGCGSSWRPGLRRRRCAGGCRRCRLPTATSLATTWSRPCPPPRVGPAQLRTVAAIRILLHNGVRTDDLLQADVADLTQDRGHRVLAVTRKGGGRARLPLAPTTWDALEAYLTERANAAKLEHWRQLSGPLLATGPGGRMRQNHLWELVRRLALALDADVSLRDVQDYAGHRDPRTTRRYDHSRGSLDRSPAYTLGRLPHVSYRRI